MHTQSAYVFLEPQKFCIVPLLWNVLDVHAKLYILKKEKKNTQFKILKKKFFAYICYVIHTRTILSFADIKKGTIELAATIIKND